MFKIQLFGSSHGPVVGVTIEGVPPGHVIDMDHIATRLQWRAPGQSKVTTRRKEGDKVEILSGVFRGETTGGPITAVVTNKDVDSSYYEDIRYTPRPGHSDYPAYVKYEGKNDFRGGGFFSGRMTLGIVIAGAIAEQLLGKRGINVQAYTREIGGVEIEPTDISEKTVYGNIVRVASDVGEEELTEVILTARRDGDSVGGIVECQIEGVPPGVGEPIFQSVEAEFARILFGIPAVKGVEFGSGFTAARMRGSEHNDSYYYENGIVKTRTNNAGGVIGGISTGMPIVFRVAFKPTSSISRTQETVNLQNGEQTTLKVKGRHDPCIVPRAVIVVQAAAACVLMDLLMKGGQR